MEREKKLFKNTIIITLGKISTSLITFFLLPLYTAYLSTEQFGVVDLVTVLTGLLAPIVTLQLEKAVFRELVDKRKSGDFNKVVTTAIFIVIIQLVLFIALYIMFLKFIAIKYSYYLLINVVLYILANLLMQTARGVGKEKHYAIASSVGAFTTIVFNIIFIVCFRLGAIGMLTGMALGYLCIIIYLFISLELYKQIQMCFFDFNTMKAMLNYSAPLVLSALSWWIFNASDRVIVTYFLGLSYTGVLSAALKFSSAYVSVYGIFDMSWTESISLSIQDKDIDDYFNEMFNNILKLFLTIVFGIIAIMPFAFPILINSSYNEGFYIVPLSLIASFFNVIVGLVSVIYIAKKDSKAIAISSVLAAMINIIIHLLLIKRIGLYASVISTIVSYVFLSIYRICDIRKKYIKVQLNFKFICESVFLLIVFLVIYYLKNLWLYLFGILICLVYMIFANKKMIKFLKNFLIKKVRSVNE